MKKNFVAFLVAALSFSLNLYSGPRVFTFADLNNDMDLMRSAPDTPGLKERLFSNFVAIVSSKLVCEEFRSLTLNEQSEVTKLMNGAFLDLLRNEKFEAFSKALKLEKFEKVPVVNRMVKFLKERLDNYTDPKETRLYSDLFKVLLGVAAAGTAAYFYMKSKEEQSKETKKVYETPEGRRNAFRAATRRRLRAEARKGLINVQTEEELEELLEEAVREEFNSNEHPSTSSSTSSPQADSSGNWSFCTIQ